MALIFKPVRSSIASKDGLKRFHPRLIKMDTVDLSTIASEITEVSAVSPGDVHSVITNLMSSMRTHLLNSNSVKLDGFGTFTVIAHSNEQGVEKEEDVNASQINRLVIRFMPEYTRTSFSGKTTKFYDGVTFRSLADMEASLEDNGVVTPGSNDSGTNPSGDDSDTGDDSGIGDDSDSTGGTGDDSAIGG